MTISIVHPKVNDIPDWTQADLDAQILAGNYPPGTVLADITLPSDWNAGHTISGATQNYVPYGAADGTLTQSANMTFDGTTLTIAGDISYSGNLISTSDRRLKTAILLLSEKGSMLERMAQISGYQYRLKGSEIDDYGVMAQELEEVFPELVHTAEDEMQTKFISQIGLIAPLIEAIKELKARIEVLEKSQ